MSIAERKSALSTQLNNMKAQREGLQAQLDDLSKGILRVEGALLLLAEMEADEAKAIPKAKQGGKIDG